MDEEISRLEDFTECYIEALLDPFKGYSKDSIHFASLSKIKADCKSFFECVPEDYDPKEAARTFLGARNGTIIFLPKQPGFVSASVQYGHQELAESWGKLLLLGLAKGVSEKDTRRAYGESVGDEARRLAGGDCVVTLIGTLGHYARLTEADVDWGNPVIERFFDFEKYWLSVSGRNSSFFRRHDLVFKVIPLGSR